MPICCVLSPACDTLLYTPNPNPKPKHDHFYTPIDSFGKKSALTITLINQFSSKAFISKGYLPPYTVLYHNHPKRIKSDVLINLSLKLENKPLGVGLSLFY